jgi:cellulose synthase/poly-beta-1,6-N-acetylglucosamine synthase-like glycosyltransferase
MKPIFIPKYIQQYLHKDHSQANFDSIKGAYQTLSKGGAEPEVSVVMPAYNEEENIVQTLASLCNNVTQAGR